VRIRIIEPSLMPLCVHYGLYVVDEANIETHGMVPMNRLTDDPRTRDERRHGEWCSTIVITRV
jgi:beta-galactosidase/beta-glucuronidase